MSSRRAAISFILVTLFLDILGIGIVIPILPKLLGQFLGNDTERTANLYGYFATAYALTQFIFSPILGSLSDRFGRRPVLIMSTLGQGLDYLLLAFAPSLWWLFAGRIIAGLTGASISTAQAYIADVTPPEKRAQSFGFIGMAFGLGFVVGPALGGVLGEYSLRLPFIVSAVLTLTNATYGFFVLPESLAPENRRPFSWAKANSFGTLAVLAKNPVILGLAGSLLFSALAQRCLESTWVLVTGYRYGWSPKQTGLSLALVGVGAAIVQGGLVRRIIPKLGEAKSFMLGLGVGALSFVFYGLSTKAWMALATIPLGTFGGIAGPAGQGLVSKSVKANEQGLLMGGLSSLISLSQIVGPFMATQLFKFFISDEAPVKVPGASFFLGAGLFVVALALAGLHFARNSAAPITAKES